MMAADSSKFHVWFIVFVLLSFFGSADSSSTADGRCVDGTYAHDGRNCCLCGAGLHLEEHCTANLQFGKCKACDPDTYSSHPNNQKSCEPCTSCSQPNANLEVDEACTFARDAKCRCKKDHYCSSGTETCRICYPCRECGAEGVKADCTANNNTVCNDKTEEGDSTGTIVGIIVAIAFIIGLVLLAFFCKRRQSKKRQHTLPQPSNGSAPDVEMQLLTVPVVDLQRHLPDIAAALGWKDMKDVAMRSNIPNPIIESCQLNHPHDTQEQALHLLKIWVEKQGKVASRSLIQILQNSDKKAKAENIMDILSRPNHPA